MKKVILSIVLVMAGLSSAYAQDDTNMSTEVQTKGIIQPYLRSCDSPYLGNNETCLSNTNSCPGGYEESQANYCCDHGGGYYRCGTICKSIYSGGH